jgi:hypothetical protein
VARAKGAKGMQVDDLAKAIEDLHDASVPERKQARELTDAVAKAQAEFTRERLSWLADVGVGVSEDGTSGEGKDGQVASDSAEAKMAAFQAGQTAFSE